MSAEHPIKNLINGNLADAKKGAKRYSYAKLYDAARNTLGLPDNVARLHCAFLKRRITWEAYCQQHAEANAMPIERAREMRAYLDQRLADGLEQEAKAKAAECDPAAVFGIAASLDKFASTSAFKGNISETYNGADQFMREIMKVGERFETWASAHVDFASNVEVWPYLLQDKFATALEESAPGSILHLSTMEAEDFARVAKVLGLKLNA